MEPKQYQKIGKLFHAALELGPHQRALFLEQACGGDGELLETLKQLIEAHEQSNSFLKQPLPVIEEFAEKLDQTIVGKQIGRYQVLSFLGAGGMGQVYLGEDTMLGRKVAIKLMRANALEDEKTQKRFLREAQAAATLDHPHICSVYEIGREGNLHFIAMQYVEGESLAKRIERQPLSFPDTLKLAIQLTDALAEAHAKGIVHRDIKPQNVMITTREQAKLLDFGLARFSPQESSIDSCAETQRPLTAPGAVMGTLGYMSPEQAHGQVTDARTDLFSLGVVFYEMLTGNNPFVKESAVATLSAILTFEPPPLTLLCREVPLKFEQVVAGLLAKDREHRCQSAGDLLADLQSLQKELESGFSSSSDTLRSVRITQRAAIAVLPFADMSPEKDQEYLCQGMAEEVINALAQIEGLRVVSRSSAFHFHGKDYDLQDLGAKLRVTTVLEGSVRRAGNRLRIAARLINVGDGFQIWAERYDREMKDVFDIQDEISRAIVQALKLKLMGDEQPLVRRYTDNLDAYHLYLKGRFHWNKRVASSVRTALECFEQALAEDPNYAPAYAGMADCYIVPGYYGIADARRVMPLGKSAALKALEIDDKVAEAYCSLGMITSVYDFEWPQGEAHFRRSIELNPSYATAYMWQAFFNLLPVGRVEDAMDQARQARKLDPLNAAINTVLGSTLYFQRRYDQAIEELNRTLELDPNFAIAHYFLGKSHMMKGFYEQAGSSFRRTGEILGGSPAATGTLGCCQALAGDVTAARDMLAEFEQRATVSYVPSLRMADIYFSLGDQEAAFAWLEKAVEERSGVMIWLKVDPFYDPWRDDPRFIAVLRKMNLLS